MKKFMQTDYKVGDWVRCLYSQIGKCGEIMSFDTDSDMEPMVRVKILDAGFSRKYIKNVELLTPEEAILEILKSYAE